MWLPFRTASTDDDRTHSEDNDDRACSEIWPKPAGSLCLVSTSFLATPTLIRIGLAPAARPEGLAPDSGDGEAAAAPLPGFPEPTTDAEGRAFPEPTSTDAEERSFPEPTTNTEERALAVGLCPLADWPTLTMIWGGLSPATSPAGPASDSGDGETTAAPPPGFPEPKERALGVGSCPFFSRLEGVRVPTPLL